MKEFQPSPKPIRLFYFWAGIIATFAYRVIIILNFYSPLWVKISWYIGTIGFILYFWHRFVIQEKRAKLVDDYKLRSLVRKIKIGDKDQRQALDYIVTTTSTSKSKWNSFFIFALSVLALIIGVIMDFF